LSAGGGAVGALVAGWLLKVLSVWRPIPQYPIHVTVTADARVHGLAVLLAAASAILPALLTARQIWKTDAMQAMKGTAQPVLRRLSVRDVLLGVQVALCALLVTSALVGLRGMQRSLHAPLGFEPQGATLAITQMKMSGYTDATALPVQKRMIEQAQQIPGVTAAATIDEIPLNAGGSSTPVYRAGTTDFRSSNSAATAKYFNISPGYLQAAQMRLIAGRDFTWADDEHHPRVVLVNQTLAHLLFGNAPAVGRHFAMPGPNDYEVIGVVEDGKYDSLTEDPVPAMFWPLPQNPENDVTLVVRSSRSSPEMAGALNGMLAKIDPTLPVTIESWPDALDLALFPARVATVALGILGMLAGMLAVTGIFGMTSYTVARRLRELGIRAALGAQRVQIFRAAIGRTVLLLGCGSVAGLLLGVMASKVLASIVYEATVYDPVVITGALAAMIAIGTAAASVPARRAVQVDPAALLREQ
ncbi:MAG TPA: ABC transporter permease, partial [Acidobacteriaceae bacterium]|nr:ABC transporter permease [Acidobacteriaceae bacterium]